MKGVRLALLAFLAAPPACDPPYEAPCRVVRQETVVADEAIGTRGAVSIARRASGGFVASWLKIDAPDAGPDPTPTIAGFDVVDLDVHGALVRRELVTAPSDLRARKGSVESAGIAREDGATLLHWTESVTSTDADGRVRTAFTLKGAYGEQVAAPRAGACTQCGMQVAVVALESESIAIVRTAPDVTLAVLGTPPVSASFLAIHFRRDGSTSSEPLPWLATPQKAGGPVLAATLDAEGRIVVASDGKSWLADRSLRPLAGPVALPTSDARALFGANGDASIAWTISATEEGRSDDPLARREVFVANASVRERISVGRAVLGADRRDGELGFAFESAGRLFFAASSPSGQKRGGDLFVGTVGGRSSELGAFVPEDATTLAATSAGTFALATLGRGALTTTEIVCAP